jgi:ADP-ribose pyrophosphatase
MKSDAMDILDVEKLTNEKWLNLFASTFSHDGKSGRWVFASRHADPRQPPACADAVMIVPILREEGQPARLVLLREFRVPIGDWIYALPAGLSEPGEPIEETVRREMLEETGLEVMRVKRVTQPLCTSAGLTDEAVALAFVDARRIEGGGQKLEAGEAIEVILADHAQVCALCQAPVRIDAKAWCILYHFEQLGRLE